MSVYNSHGISRGAIWRKIGNEPVREDYPEAALYRLLIRDSDVGGIICQHGEKDWAGNFHARTPQKRNSPSRGPKRMESAFDEEDAYELSELGQQFVHYTMTELPLKIEYHATDEESKKMQESVFSRCYLRPRIAFDY